MNGSPSDGADVALFIDWENFKISLASGHRNPNVSALKEEVGNHGRVVVAKAYADWVTRAPELRGASQFTNDPPALYAAGIEPVYVPTRLPPVGAASDSLRTARVKNSVDVKMTADCIECAHSYSNIGTYVLVSGDSDFIHVINTLRAMGKRVIIIGVSWSTSRRLADQVDGLILYDTDVDPVAPVEPTPPPAARGNGRSTGAGQQQLAEVMATIEDIVRLERQAGRTPLLTSLKQRVMRRMPGFDEKKLGFSGFKKLMQRVAQEGNIKLVTVGLVDWVLMADEPDPQEQTEDTSTTGEIAVTEAPAETESDPKAEEAAPSSSRNGRKGTGRRGARPVTPEEQPVESTNVETAPAETTSPETTTAQTTTVEATSVEAGVLQNADLSEIQLPEGPGDGLDGQRVSDLIIMANTLEQQEGISHVAFNFLIGEICGALEEGLKAENAEISLHWGQMHSRTYVTRIIRSLSDAGVFQRGWHAVKDEETGRNRRRRTFNLDRDHALVAKVLGVSETASEVVGEQSDMTAALTGTEEGDLLPADNEVGASEALSPSLEPGEADDASSIGKVFRFFSRS